MIEVQMSDDIRKYEPKFVGPFNKRQFICVAIGAGIGVLGALISPGDAYVKVGVFLVLTLIPASLGYINPNGTYAEIFIARLIYKFFLAPGKRKYKRENTYKKAITEMLEAEERAKISRMSPQEQKKYYKKKETSKVVKYSNKKEYRMYH